MNRRSLPVVAAIPAYNEERNIGHLLKQVLEDEYDEVIVRDDSSTDNTLEVLSSFKNDIRILAGEQNVGSGESRNRIVGSLGYEAIIHFIDADLRINSICNPERAKDCIQDPSVAFVGGLIRSADKSNGELGDQSPWNYGPALSLPQMVSSWIYTGAYRLETTRKGMAKPVRNGLDRWAMMRQWPHVADELEPKDVFWTAEANMVTTSEVFEVTGGYDPRLRYHEVMEFAQRLNKLGLRRRFDPSIDTTHQPNKTINNSNTKDFWLGLGIIAIGMSPRELLRLQATKPML